MTITRNTNGNKTARGKKALMKDVLAALEAAGVNDPTLAQRVAESLANGNGNDHEDNQTKTPKQAEDPAHPEPVEGHERAILTPPRSLPCPMMPPSSSLAIRSVHRAYRRACLW